MNTDNAWRHFTLTYTPPEKGSTIANVSYYYNDKKYDGTMKPYNNYDKALNEQVDISKLTDNSTLSDPYKVRWGFTASTGSPNSAPSTYAVVMQEMPNVANIDSEVKLFDLSQYDSNGVKGREISDLDKRPSASLISASKDPKYNVANGDSLRFDYNLNYTSGFAGTGENIKTVMNLPKNVNFVPDTTTKLGQNGDVGQIIYSNFENESDNKTVPISASDITTDASGNSVLNLSLTKMSKENENIKVEMFGKAHMVDLPTKVLGEHTSYKSLHYIDDIMSPSFLISDKMNLTTNDDLDLGTINATNSANNSVNLNLSLSYDNSKSVFDNKNVMLYTKIDNKNPVSTTINTSDGKATYDIANNISGSTELNATSLGTGDHTITVYAVDSLGRTTNEITYQVTVEGKELKLLVDPSYKFQNINYLPSDGYIKRLGDWKVSVLSADTPWTLMASGENLKLDDDKTKDLGPMVYRNKNKTNYPLNDGTPIIASSNSQSETPKKTDISSEWNSNDGILLEDNAVKTAGHYSGEITWRLIDSI